MPTKDAHHRTEDAPPMPRSHRSDTCPTHHTFIRTQLRGPHLKRYSYPPPVPSTPLKRPEDSTFFNSDLARDPQIRSGAKTNMVGAWISSFRSQWSRPHWITGHQPIEHVSRTQQDKLYFSRMTDDPDLSNGRTRLF
ncbi:hypothetical protein M0R45_007286 [Rubus argutus]|uniref:Uncharacterized protein n=1 Tax=Rubus argutus TaxID=59490 RepID=A0AAW1XYA8_RUBAR